MGLCGEAFLPDVAEVEGFLCGDIVPADFGRNLRAFVLEEFVQFGFEVIDFATLPAAGDIVGADSVIEAFLSDLIEFFGLVDGKIVSGEVGERDFLAVPVRLGDEQGCALLFLWDVVFPGEIADVFSGDAFALGEFGRGVPFLDVRVLLRVEESPDVFAWVVEFAAVAEGFDSRSFDFAVEPGLSYAVGVENLVFADVGPGDFFGVLYDLRGGG